MKPKLTALFLAALMLAGCTPTGSSSDTTDSVLTDTPTAEATEAPTETYTQEAVRNNITEVRVTNDAENLYFYIKCEADIVVSDDAGWMNLFIGTGSSPTVKGWESYEFAINRARNGSTATVEKLNPDYTGEALEATATYSVRAILCRS